MLYDVGSVKRRDKIRQEMLKRRTACDRPLRGEERGIKTLRISDSVNGRISSDSDSAGSPLVRHGVREVREAKRFLSDPQGFDLECVYERCERNDRRDSFKRENSLYEWRGRETAQSGRSGNSEREVSGRSGISEREVRGDSLEGEMYQDYTALKDSSSSDSKKSDGEERRSVFGEEERRSVFGEEEKGSVFGEEERSVRERRESCGSCSDSW